MQVIEKFNFEGPTYPINHSDERVNEEKDDVNNNREDNKESNDKQQELLV